VSRLNSHLFFKQELLITHTHPSLPGHFPDNPIVPGVVILDHVMNYWQNNSGKTIRQINQSKFIQLLTPDQPCTIIYSETKQPDKINFEIINSTQKVIAKGSFSYD